MSLLPLQILSFLCQLHTSRSDRSRLGQLVPLWRSQLAAESASLLTSRQWRRWQLLHAYWQRQGPQLMAHGMRRGLIVPELADELLSLELAPPEQLQQRKPDAGPCTALFITALPGGESVGECQVLELRQVLALDRFPPLHLSARVADAAILSAGNLALEALSQWLGRRLALETPFPLWAEAAFPDTVRLVDESASLAFVAGVMQHLFAQKPETGGFSGIVRRDSGRIEPVQGFDAAYGKLEAAFDAGVCELYLPTGTPLAALPQAGILLTKQSDTHYRYAFADQPEDIMDIHLIGDLEQLFEIGFRARAPEAIRVQLERLSLSLAEGALPAIQAWQTAVNQLEACLPQLLHSPLQGLNRSYRQAYELFRAGLDADWESVSGLLNTFITELLSLLAALITSVALQTGPWSRRRHLLERLQALIHPVPLLAWCELLASPELQAALNDCLPELRDPLTALLGFARGLEKPARPDVLWNRLRFLIRTQTLTELFADLSLSLSEPASLSGPARLQTSRDQSWELPLIQTVPTETGHRLLTYAGMGELHPLYRDSFSDTVSSLAGACPYLPERLLDISRRFLPLHTQQGDALRYGLESVTVSLRLRNLSYLPLQQFSLTESLPDGLSCLEGQISWRGELAPLQEIELEYRFTASEPGRYLLAAPTVSYRLPAPYELNEFSMDSGSESPAMPDQELIFEADTRPRLTLVREAPTTALTRQKLSLKLQLSNHSPQPAHHLRWLTPLVPEGLQLVNADQASELPERLGPYESLDLVLIAEALLPGMLSWPALKLSYQGIETEVYQLGIDAESLQVHFNRELPVSGREPELAWLEACLINPALQGLLLWGERGSGKRQLLTAWQLHSALVCELQGDAFLDLPLLGARSLIRQILELLSRQSIQLGPEQTLLEAFVDSRLEADPETDRQLKARFFQAVLRVIAALTQQAPLLLKIHQLEHLDTPSLELLRFLLLNRARVFLALSGTSAELPETLADLDIAVRELPRLDRQSIISILDQMFSPHNLPSALAEGLQARTQGVSLYLQEYLAWLVQTGLIVPEQGVWTLNGTLATLPVPEQLERLILKEFKALVSHPASAAAAVLGPEFATADLLSLVPESLSWLAQARERGLLAESPSGWAFKHPLYHELFYRQAASRTAGLHAEAARYFARQGVAPARVAQHWLRAGEHEQALDYLLRLGEQALRQGAYSAAASWLSQADKLVTAENPEIQARWLQLYRLQGELYRHTEHQAKARDSYQIYLRLAHMIKSEPDLCRAWLGLGILSQQSEALEALHQAHTLARQLADPELIAQSCLQLGIHFSEARSYDEGQSWFYQALGMSAPDSVAQAEILELMGYETIKAGQTQMAENYLLQSKLLYERHQQLQGLASVYNRLGACCFYAQELARARHYFSESRRYCLQTGNQLKLAQVDHNLGLLAEASREFSQAETIFSQNLARAVRLGDVKIQGFAWNQLGSVSLKLRQLDPAREALNQARALLEQATDQRGMAYVQLNLGLLALLEGDAAAAREVLTTARQTLDGLRDIMGQDQALLRLGHSAWLADSLDEARELYGRCLDARRVLDKKQEDGLERVHHALGLVFIKSGELQTAEQHLLAAESLFEKRREIGAFAVCCHNLSWLYQSLDADKAQSYREKRDLLIGLDREPHSRLLQDQAGLVPVLD